MSQGIDVAPALEASDEIVGAIARLLPQLSSSAPSPEREQLRQIVDSPCTTLLVARDPQRENAIVGCLTLAVFRIPSGVRAWIEDVVVDGEARGRGVGEALSRAAVELAAARGARTVELTSRASREAANRLYQRIGFEARDTNVYRYAVGAEHGSTGEEP